MTTIEKLDMNVKQANSDFVAIKNKIVEKGVDVSAGTRTADYAEKIDEVYTKGYDVGKEDGNILYYATSLYATYSNASFPEPTDLVLKLQKMPNRSDNLALHQTFFKSGNLRSVKFITDDKESSFAFSQTFRENNSIEVVDLTECPRNIIVMNYCFFQASNLVSILGALNLSQCTTSESLTYAFFAGKLRDVEIVPNTIKANIRFSSAYLSQVSIESIINGLADLTDGETQTLTLNGVGASLTDDQKARIEAKNWTLAY